MVATVKPVAGGERLEAYLSNLARKLGKGGTVRVGFLENATYPDGTSVAMVAAINNYGAPAAGIPPRPFFTNMVNREAGGWGVDMAKALKATGDDVPKALALMGERIAGKLREAIVDTNDPPNSPVTNLLKQRFPQGGQTFDDVLQARADVAAGAQAPAGKPLVQSGVMLAAVDYEVEAKP